MDHPNRVPGSIKTIFLSSNGYATLLPAEVWPLVLLVFLTAISYTGIVRPLNTGSHQVSIQQESSNITAIPTMQKDMPLLDLLRALALTEPKSSDLIPSTKKPRPTML